jgi:hypothetical protein
MRREATVWGVDRTDALSHPVFDGDFGVPLVSWSRWCAPGFVESVVWNSPAVVVVW